MENIAENISSIAGKLIDLEKDALNVYVPIVDEIVKNNIQDENHIQFTLDRILDFCYSENMLYQYRKLCKYYYDINPRVVVEYVEYYKDMYDPDGENFGRKRDDKNG